MNNFHNVSYFPTWNFAPELLWSVSLNSNVKHLSLFQHINYNTNVMSFICSSSLKFYMWQSDISDLLNIRLLPVIIVLISFKIGLSQVNQQWNLITVFQVRCFDLIFDKQSFIIKETYKAFFSVICSKQVMFWLIFDKQKFIIKETYKTWYQ